jgi:hypothetical protein
MSTASATTGVSDGRQPVVHSAGGTRSRYCELVLDGEVMAARLPTGALGLFGAKTLLRMPAGIGEA